MPNGQDPATKNDVASAKDELRSEIALAKDELRGEIALAKDELRGDIALAKDELRGDIALAKDELRGDIRASEDRVVEVMRDIQTELLKAFYSFTTSQQHRLSQVEGNESAVVARLGTLEARVLDLERKVNFPGHPAQ